MLRAHSVHRREGEAVGEDRSQEGRKHIFAINGAPEFLNIVRELFQEEAYNVTTTNYVPNSFEQIHALPPDALIVDIVVGQSAGWELLERLHAEAETNGIPVLVALHESALAAARPGPGRAVWHSPLPGQAVRRRRAADHIREMIGEA